MSNLIGNPEDRFSRITAHMILAVGWKVKKSIKHKMNLNQVTLLNFNSFGPFVMTLCYHILFICACNCVYV